jgi:glycosyltransferase involved in cell wall biosynthesis
MAPAAFRVLYLLTEPFITGGVQSDMKSLGPYFVEKGHEVFIACPPGDQTPHLDRAGVVHIPLDVHFKTPSQLKRQSKALRELILTLKPTVIAPQSIRSSWVAHNAVKDLPVLRVTTIHNIHTPVHGLWAGFLLDRFSDLVIFESDHEYKRLTGLGLSAEKARVVPSGIDTRNFHPASPKQEILDSIPCLKKNSVVFGCVADCQQKKPIPTF